MFLSIGPGFVIRTYSEGTEDRTAFNKKKMPFISKLFL